MKIAENHVWYASNGFSLIPVLQPGFKKGRVHIIKRALSSWEAASVGGGITIPLGGGMGDLPQEKFWKSHLKYAFSCYFWQFLNAEKRVTWKANKCWWGSIVAEAYLLFV